MGAVPTEAMFRKSAWHAVGNVMGDTFTWADAEAADFGFLKPVEKVAMRDLILAYSARSDEYAAVREDGIVLKCGHGEQWTPFQVSEAKAFGDTIAGHDRLESLGELWGGRNYFFTYALGEFTIGDHVIKDHLSVNGSFDGSWPLQVLSSPIVEVCENTVAFAVTSGAMHYRFKHTSGIFDRVAEAVKALERHHANVQTFKQVGDKLLATKVSEGDYTRILDALFPLTQDTPTKTANTVSAARDTVCTLWLSQGQSFDPVLGAHGTGWGLVQAVNTYENWGQPIRKQKGVGEATTRAIRQIDQLVTGKQPLTNRAMELVLA